MDHVATIVAVVGMLVQASNNLPCRVYNFQRKSRLKRGEEGGEEAAQPSFHRLLKHVPCKGEGEESCPYRVHAQQQRVWGNCSQHVYVARVA